MAPCCAPACSPALPVKPQGVWARGSEAWAGSRDRRNLEFVRWGSSGPSSLMVKGHKTIFKVINELLHRNTGEIFPDVTGVQSDLPQKISDFFTDKTDIRWIHIRSTCLGSAVWSTNHFWMLTHNLNNCPVFVWFQMRLWKNSLFLDQPNAANYRKTSSISRTKFQSLNVSCVLLQLSSLNPLKPGVKLRMKM